MSAEDTEPVEDGVEDAGLEEDAGEGLVEEGVGVGVWDEVGLGVGVPLLSTLWLDDLAMCPRHILCPFLCPHLLVQPFGAPKTPFKDIRANARKSKESGDMEHYGA